MSKKTDKPIGIDAKVLDFTGLHDDTPGQPPMLSRKQIERESAAAGFVSQKPAVDRKKYRGPRDDQLNMKCWAEVGAVFKEAAKELGIDYCEAFEDALRLFLVDEDMPELTARLDAVLDATRRRRR